MPTQLYSICMHKVHFRPCIGKIIYQNFCEYKFTTSTELSSCFNSVTVLMDKPILIKSSQYVAALLFGLYFCTAYFCKLSTIFNAKTIKNYPFFLLDW